MADTVLSLATQEMQGAHVYVLGVIAVGVVGGLIYVLVRRIAKNVRGRPQTDQRPEAGQGPEAPRSAGGPEA
jgi:hypothetical protein